MKTRTLVLPALVAAIAAIAACSAGSGPESPGNVNTAGTGSTPHSNSGGTGNIVITDLGGTGQVDPNDTREFEPREQICTDPADPSTCTCLRLALVGSLDSSANQKDTGPFVDWLNANSDGTATATLVTTKPAVFDAAWLSQYDVIISANINTWAFTPEEKAAIETWARTTAGGIVSLTGFSSDGNEPALTSQLIEWSGVRYTTPEAAREGASQSLPLYAPGGTTNLRDCALSGDAIITGPVVFVPQTGTFEKLTQSLSQVGAFRGWSVEAPAGSIAIATDPTGSLPIAVAHEVDRTGRVLAFGDEWVVFANQWQGTPNNQQADQYNPCWVAATADSPAYIHSVATVYQTKQFWYNAINWVAPPNKCNFIIDDPEVVILY